MIRHVAGEPIGGVQRCTWCNRVLVEWQEELNPRPSIADVRALFFRPGRDVIESRDGSTFTSGTESDERVPACIPSVEGVHVQ